MELEDDKLEQLKAIVDSDKFRPKDLIFGPYPMAWPMLLSDSSLFNEKKEKEFITEYEAWKENRKKNREEYDFKEDVQDAIGYFERIFESAFKELIELSTDFIDMFSIASDWGRSLQKDDNDIEKVERSFYLLCNFLEEKLIDKIKSFSLEYTLYGRKNVIIESITTKSQFSEDIIDFLIAENRIVLVERLIARIRGDVCILFYFIHRTFSERKQRSDTIDFFLYLIKRIRSLIRDEYRYFLYDIEFSFKQKNVSESVHAQFQQLKELIVNNESICSWKEIGVALGRGREYMRLLKIAMESAGVEMIGGQVTLNQVKKFIIETDFCRTQTGYKFRKSEEEFKYSKRKVTKKK